MAERALPMSSSAPASEIDKAFDDLACVLVEARRVLREPLERAISLLRVHLARGGRVLVCGNGGSAAHAQHLVSELVGRVDGRSLPLPALALGADFSVMTALANDFGYEHVFARELAALARHGDVLVAFSTSGKSPNVLAAARSARALGLCVLSMTGRDPGPLGQLSDVFLAAPSTTVSRIQEVHQLCVHVLAHGLKES